MCLRIISTHCMKYFSEEIFSFVRGRMAKVSGTPFLMYEASLQINWMLKIIEHF